MRTFIFEKAKYLLKETKIIYEGEYSMRLQVGSNDVEFRYRKHKLVVMCSCRAGGMLAPCSHMMAAITYMIENNA